MLILTINLQNNNQQSLQKYTLPKIILHWFSGELDTIKALCNLDHTAEFYGLTTPILV